MECKVSIHNVKGKQKLLITMDDKSLSLYKEDAEMLAAFISRVVTYLSKRNEKNDV